MAALERGGEAGPLVVGELDGRAHLGDVAVALAGGQLEQPVDDRRQLAGPAGADHQRDEGDGDVGGLAAEEVLDDLLAARRRQVGVGQRLAQLVVALEDPGEAEQLVGDLAEMALIGGNGEQRLGVARDSLLDSALFGHEPISFEVSSTGAPVDRSAGRSDLGDVVLDQLHLRRAVEVLLHHDLGGADRQGGDFAGEVGQRLGLRRFDVGRGPQPHLGDLGLRPPLQLGPEAIGGGPGVLDDAGGLALGARPPGAGTVASSASASVLASSARVEIGADALASGPPCPS